MSSLKTEHYGLHKWEPGDDFLRQEFNENFSSIDAVLGAVAAGQARFASGSYMGNGKFGNSGDNAPNVILDFGFTPKVLFIVPSSSECRRFAVWLHGLPDCAVGTNAQVYATWTETGISWWGGTNGLDAYNGTGTRYTWLAIG